MEDLDAFCRWTCGPLMETRTRGAYAEGLVHRALGVDPGQYRVEGAAGTGRSGALTLEVTSAACLQAWPQPELGRIRFPIEQRSADIQVYCLLEEQDPGRVEPHDLTQWRFWVVSTRRLHPERRSISLQALRRAHGEGLRDEQPAVRIRE